ncbi:MAG: response regulator [Pirellulales bacterium]|nr:response regulator [Pirellulales bacterium]
MRHAAVAILLAWPSGHAAVAVEPFQPAYVDPLSEPWRVRVFPELSGLGANCVSEAADGTMWFGAVGGVWSYDGFDWVHHSEPDCPNQGDSVCAGPGGEVLVAIGSFVYQFKNKQWTPLFPPHPDRIDLTFRKLVTAKDGTVWAATSSGALRYADSTWTLYTTGEIAARLAANQLKSVRVEIIPEKVVQAPRTSTLPAERHDFEEVCIDPRGRVWLGTAGGEVLCFDRSSGTWSLFNETDGLTVGRRPAILGLSDGSTWVAYGIDSDGLNIYDGESWRIESLEGFGAPARFGSPIEAKDGTVWLSGHYRIGVYRDGQWTTYAKPEHPVPYALNFLLQSSDGALWIGGSNTEIVRIDYQTSRWLTIEDLNFGWESPAGEQWFLHRNGRVVVNRDDDWTSYGPEDGVINAPTALMGTRSGEVWVAGSHDSTAATARFDGTAWTRFVHDELSWGVDPRGVLEASDGSLWFSAAVDSSAHEKYCHGILQFKNGVWIHHHQAERTPTTGVTELLPKIPQLPAKLNLLGESRDGRIWAGRNLLIARGPDGWVRIPPTEPETGAIFSMLSTSRGDLWIGSQQHGVLSYDGTTWTNHQGERGLSANSVFSLAETEDGAIWAATDRGFSRFDGDLWTPTSLPAQLTLTTDGGGLKASGAGSVWINRCSREWSLRAWPLWAEEMKAATIEYQTTRRRFHGPAPRTAIVAGDKTVQHPGNLSVLWTGAAAWSDGQGSQMQYSYRLDDQPWSPFTPDRGTSFFSLPAGAHRLEVQARDKDFNVDPTPAILEFVVTPPVWRQSWFMGMIVTFAGLIAAQSYRVVRERGRLRRANTVLGTEIVERIRTQEEIRAANERYAEQEAALTSLTQAYALHRPEATELIRDAVEIVARTLRTRLASVWVYGSDQRTLACRERFDQTADAQATGTTLAADDCPGFFAQIATGALFSVAAAAEDERTRGFAAALFGDSGKGAILAVPIHVSGSVAGVLCAEHVGSARQWTTDEETFAIAAANMISLLFAEEARGQVEERLRQSQKMEAIGQLAGGVAHDFNNILAAVIMQLEVLRMRKENPAEVLEGLQEIQSSAERAADLTRQLLLFGSKQMLRPQKLDLNESVRQIVRMLERLIGEDVALRLQLHPEPLPVKADAGMVDQVLVNLAVNARDAMPAGGELTIETIEATIGAPLPGYQPEVAPGRYAGVVVRDAGVGIPPEILPRILDPFFTTKEPGKGTGLGLATVFGIVKHHNGCLNVQSEVGAGTTITILLPYAADAQGSERVSSQSGAAPRGRRETILLVEDEGAVRRLAQTILEQGGYRVLATASGVEALELWRTNSEPIALLLTDLVMPGGVNGLEVARRLREDDPGIKVLYMTGYSPDAAGKELRLGDLENVIAKPFTQDAILRKIRECLEG